MYFYNGRLINDAQAMLDVRDRGWSLADGCFETLRVVYGQLVWPAVHLQRLNEGLATLQIAAPVSVAQLQSWVSVLYDQLNVAEGVARLQVSRGVPAQRGLHAAPDMQPTVTLSLAESGWPTQPRAFRVLIARSTRRNEYSPLTRFKALACYPDHILALQEAQAAGYNDALLLNTRGDVVCGTVANLWLLRGAVLSTPPLAAGALAGTVRRWICAAAPQLGLSVQEAAITPADLLTADELWLSNVGMGIGVVRALHDQHTWLATPYAEKMHALLTTHLFG